MTVDEWLEIEANMKTPITCCHSNQGNRKLYIWILLDKWHCE